MVVVVVVVVVVAVVVVLVVVVVVAVAVAVAVAGGGKLLSYSLARSPLRSRGRRIIMLHNPGNWISKTRIVLGLQ